jgi:hypothetical protein
VKHFNERDEENFFFRIKPRGSPAVRGQHTIARREVRILVRIIKESDQVLIDHHYGVKAYDLVH